ncbi:Uncharacterised protein [Mycobacteroides abscessus]|nr:Uncharacterised protein [Mycobacteroides abscessus]
MVRERIRPGIASASRRVAGRANTTTNMRTRPVPNEMRAAACPSPIVLPSWPLTAACMGPRAPARTVATTSRAVAVSLTLLRRADGLTAPP